jgi:hypothetical protein
VRPKRLNGQAPRFERASNAAWAAAPGDENDDGDTWRAKVATRRAVFYAENGSAPTNATPPNPSNLLQQVIERNSEALAKYEELLGLTAPNPQFRRLLCDAIVLCVHLQCHPPRVIREGLIRVGKAAKAVSKDLLSLYRAVDDLAPQYRLDRLNIDPATLPQAALFDGLSAIAARHANMRKQIDEGGAPKMVAFTALVAGLARAFKLATGKDAKVTRNPYEGRYGGRFITLVEAVLPLVRNLTEHLGASLRYPPTPLARGKFIYEQTRAGRDKRLMCW